MSIYISIPKQPGIRKNTNTGKFLVTKKINGKKYAKSFDTIRQAQQWRATFNGEHKVEVQKGTSTLGDVWRRMKELHFPSLAKSTQAIWLRRWEPLSEMANYHMEDITSTLINNWLVKKKKWYSSEEYRSMGRGSSARCNLYNELNLFTTIFNWYKAEDEFEAESAGLTTPIRPRHRNMAFIKDTPKNPDDKKITVEAAFKFFSALPELYRDLAMTQFYCAGRIGEVSGIQIPNIHLDEEYLIIKDSIVWNNRNKTFEYLSPFPKNKQARRVYIHPTFKEIIKRRLKLKHPGCNYLFHVEGKPLNYCTIQVNYRSAQRKTGIPYTGTHCLRHGMATLARKVGGMGLDSVIAMTGHKDLKLADHYSKIDGEVQKETSLKILEHINKLGLTEAQETGKNSNVIPLRRIK